MARKLNPDYINFTLTLDASAAQQEINKLNKSSKEMRDANKALRESMNNLIAEGKKQSDEFKNLEAEYKQNTSAISENEAKVRQLLSTIDRGGKSYAQLSKEAKALQRQLDNTVKSLNPDEYNRLQQELDETRAAMNRLRNESGENGGLMDWANNAKNVVMGMFAQVGYTITETIGQAIQAVQQFVSESIEMATQADGVQHAFDQLNRSDLLANLREATKGTVTDLQLMQAVVKARDFRIPVDDLGKYLAFAQLKAQQTGQSVEYMTDSIVTGLGRKSLLILDNLGLSASEINEAVSKTGDFMQGVASIVDKTLEQAGQYVSAADKVAQADVRMENLKLKLGQRLSWVGDAWINLKNTMADALNGVMTTANEKFYEQREATVNLCTEILPLIDRYDQLKAQTELSSSEQAELTAIIRQLAEIIPGITTAWDEYGQVLDINSEKARNFIEQQKELLRYQNREAIKETEENIRRYQAIYEQAERETKQGGRYIIGGDAMSPRRILLNDEDTLREIEETRKKYGELLRGAQAELERLNGDTIEKAVEQRKKMAEQREIFIRMNRDQLEQWLADEENANSEYRDLANSILTGKTTTTDGGDNKKTDSPVKAQEKLNAEMKALKEENMKEEAALDEKQTNDRLARIESDYKKRKSKIQEKQATMAALNKENGTAGLNDNGLTSSQQEDIDNAYRLAEERRAKETEALRKEQIAKEEQELRAFLVTYGTLQDQKLAIAKDYAEKIKNATTEGEKMTLQQQMNEALSGIDMEQLKESVNWEMVFGDMGKMAKKELEEVRKQLKAFQNSEEYKNMSLDQKSVLGEAIQKIDDTLSDKGGLLGSLPSRIQELAEAQERSKQAQEELTQAQVEYNMAMAIGTDAEKAAASAKLKNARQTKNQAEQDEQSAEANLGTEWDKTITRVTSLSEAVTQLGSTSEMSLTEIGSLVSSTASVFGQAAGKIGGVIGAILSLVDQISEQGLVNFVTNLFDTVFGAVHSVFDSLLGWTGIDFGGESDKTLHQDFETLTASNQALENAIDRLSDEIAESTTSITQAGTLYEQQVESLNQREENTQELMKRYGASYSNGFLGIGGDRSSAHNLDEAATANEWRMISELVGREINDSIDFLNLSSEEMYNVAYELPEIYARFKTLLASGHEDASQFMDEYIAFYEEREELEQSYREKLTSVSFDDVESDFKNMLLDMESDTEDFAENFEDIMKQAVINSMMSDTYAKKLEKLYEDFAKEIEDDGTLSADEQADLKRRYDNIVNQALEERDALIEMMGWSTGDEEDSSSSDSYTQSSTKGYSTSMSQETGEEISGRLTAVYESNLRIESQFTGITIQVSEMSDAIVEMARRDTSAYECTTEIRDILIEANDHLYNIERNANRMAEMQETLENIEKNTKNI